MAGVKGQWEVNLSIGGVQVGVTKDLIPSLLVRSSIHSNLPSVDITFSDDRAYWLNKMGLGDGVPITVEVGDGGSGGESYQFQMQGSPKNLEMQGTKSVYRVVGVLDKLNWMRKLFDTPVTGNSSDVMKKMAEMAGLKFSGHPSKDQMPWLPNQTPFAQYARMVTERAFASNTSCFVMAITEGAELLFKDLDKIIKGGPQQTFGYGSGQLPYMGFGADSKAGAYNNQTGYGSSTIFEQLDGTFKELNKVSLTKMGNFLNVGAAVQGLIGEAGGRLAIAPFGGGNTHEKWEEARHQNKRIKDLWSNDVSVMAQRFSGVQLLQNVGFNPVMGGSAPDLSSYAGNYISTAKAIGMVAGQFVEKFTLTNQGNSSGAAGGFL